MTVLATATNPAFSVSRIDIDRPGLTYTIDTLRELRDDPARMRSCSSSRVLTRWPRSWIGARPHELFSMAHFVGVTRPGYELALDERFPQGTVSLLEMPALTISSSDCRRPGELAGCRSGISCPIRSSATSTSATSIATTDPMVADPRSEPLRSPESRSAPIFGRNVPPWSQGSYL